MLLVSHRIVNNSSIIAFVASPCSSLSFLSLLFPFLLPSFPLHLSNSAFLSHLYLILLSSFLPFLLASFSISPSSLSSFPFPLLCLPLHYLPLPVPSTFLLFISSDFPFLFPSILLVSFLPSSLCSIFIHPSLFLFPSFPYPPSTPSSSYLLFPFTSSLLPFSSP